MWRFLECFGHFVETGREQIYGVQLLAVFELFDEMVSDIVGDRNFLYVI